MATVASLVVNIAADTSDIRRNVEQMNGTFTRAEGMAKNLGRAMMAAFTVTAIVQVGKEVLNFAGRMQDLSQKTGISVTGLQKLDLAFKQSGVSLDTVTRATGELGARLVGNKGAVKLLGDLGLNVDALKRMAPEQQFLTVADAVGKIQNKSEQLFASKTLFGRGGVEMLAGLTGNLESTTAEFERMGLIIDEKTIKAADDLGDQLPLLGRQLLGVAGQALAPFIPLLTMLATQLSRVLSVLAPLVAGFIEFAVKGVMAAHSAVMNFVAGLLDMATKIPILGKHLGFAADAADVLRAQAAKSDEMLAKLSSTTVTVGHAAADAAPEVLGLGGATEAAGKVADKAATAIRNLSNELAEAEMKTLGEFYAAVDESSRILNTQLIPAVMGMEMGMKGFAEATRLANNELRGLTEDGLIPSNTELATALQRHIVFGHTIKVTANEAERAKGIFGQMGDSLKNIWKGMTGVDEEGKSKGLQGLFANLGKGLIDGFGQLLSGGLTNLVNAAIGKLADLGKKLWKAITGGPSEAELAGREAAAKFRKGLEEGLSAAQTAEAMSTGNFAWAASVIAIRDAYLALGKTEAEALAMADALWRAEKEGPEAVAKVIAELQPILDAHKKIIEETAEAAKKAAGEIAGLTDPLDVLREKLDAAEIVRKLSKAFEDFGKTGKANVSQIITWVQQLEKSLGSDNEAVKILRQAITDWATTGVLDMAKLAEAFEILKGQLEAGIKIPIDVEGESGSDGGKGNEGSSDRGGYLTPEEAREAGVPYRPKSDFDWSDSVYRAIRDEDESERNRQREEPTYHRGGIVDFAKWTKAHRGMLAYDEMPIIAQRGEGIISRKGMQAFDRVNQGNYGGAGDYNKAMYDELCAMRAELAAMRREFPSTVGTSVKDGLVLAGRRRTA